MVSEIWLSRIDMGQNQGPVPAFTLFATSLHNIRDLILPNDGPGSL